MPKKRGRPPGTSGRTAVFTPSQVWHIFRAARARSRHAARAEAALAMSLGLGLRAKELTSLPWADVYDAEAALVGLGLAGRRGRLALRRLRLAVTGLAFFVAGIFISALAPPTEDARVIAALLSMGWATICGCYVAFALWLTRDEIDGLED